MGRSEDIFSKLRKENEKAIDELIATRKSEELFLDFKRSKGSGKGKVLNDIDIRNLAKAISGFGNSRRAGSADVATTKYPITDVKQFVSWLEGAVSGCTVPPHVSVENYSIVADENGNSFAVTYVPKSNNAPHQVVGELKYYIRAGSSFVSTPHQVLAGMFGRRPQPHVFHAFLTTFARIVKDGVGFEVGFLLHNKGPGITKDLFINVVLHSTPGDGCKVEFRRSDPDNFSGQFSFGRHFNLISKADLRLPPESHVQLMTVSVLLVPPFSKPLRIEGICGCGNARSYRFTLGGSADKIKSLIEDAIIKDRYGNFTKEEGHKLVRNILGIQNIEKGEN